MFHGAYFGRSWLVHGRKSKSFSLANATFATSLQTTLPDPFPAASLSHPHADHSSFSVCNIHSLRGKSSLTSPSSSFCKLFFKLQKPTQISTLPACQFHIPPSSSPLLMNLFYHIFFYIKTTCLSLVSPERRRGRSCIFILSLPPQGWTAPSTPFTHLQYLLKEHRGEITKSKSLFFLFCVF